MRGTAMRAIENDTPASFERRYEAKGVLHASRENAFEFLDDPRRLSSHMGKSSWMMMGSKMDMALGEGGGKKEGSEIVLSGKMMGLRLFVRERVIERVVPERKVWETIGGQKMIVIDQYRMGFGLEALGEETKLVVFIEYSLPKTFLGRLLGQLFAGFYARWCTEKMIGDAIRHFSPASVHKACCH